MDERWIGYFVVMGGVTLVGGVLALIAYLGHREREREELRKRLMP
jgi:hypothetical protein